MTAIGVGTRVKCVKRGEWDIVTGYATGPGPAFGTVWTVLAMDPEGFDFISLQEWHNPRHLFDISRFIPLDGNEDITALEELLRNPALTYEPA